MSDIEDSTAHLYTEFSVVNEGKEPRGFWNLLGGKSLHAPGLPTLKHIDKVTSSKNIGFQNPPRLLICSCSVGHFVAEENALPLYPLVQTDLPINGCAILDPGGPFSYKIDRDFNDLSFPPVYIWCGRGASDVVRKLTKKAAEIWITSQRPKGWYISPDYDRKTFSVKAADIYRPIKEEIYGTVWIEGGHEPLDFKGLFLGWDNSVRILK